MLKVNDISFQYSDKKEVLKDVSFILQTGQHLCIMGESGSGKSTLLKIIYGVLDVQQGDLFWKDRQILGPALHLVPGMESFKYVAQDFDLMPYTSVSENIGKFLSRFYPEEKEIRTKKLLEVIEMTDFAHTKVKNLSGGQQQRVAIARALAKEPELLLLDEPFSQIDNFKKNSLSRKLFNYLKEKNIACIVAAHDGSDALSFADQMIVIKDQQVIANDTPANLYQNPSEKYVAGLFNDVNEVLIDNNKVLLYPHQINLAERSGHKATVINSYFKGFYWLVEVNYRSQSLFFHHPRKIASGNSINIDFLSVP